MRISPGARQPPRVMILGLDGATFTWVRPLVAAGKLPVLARLIAEGTSGPLESIIPPHTGAAWPSLITGRNPGKTGLFYFERYDVARYACLNGFATAETIVGRTIFDSSLIGDLRVAALRVPMTYPTWPVNGVMASGYPAPADTVRSMYPRALAKVMPPMGTLPIHGASPEHIAALLAHETEALTTAACHILASDTFDLGMVVYQQPDQAQHFFWRYADPTSPLYTEDEAEAYGDLIARCYQSVDAGIGRLLECCGDETLVLVVSDHGAECAPKWSFQANQWLCEQGLLAVQPPSVIRREARTLFNIRQIVPKDIRRNLRHLILKGPSASLRDSLSYLGQGTEFIDWHRTRAYRFPVAEQMEGLAINLKGRQPHGIVEPAEYDGLCARLTAELRHLRQPGTDAPLVTEVHRREEVFWGPHAHRAPDLLYRLAPGFESRGELHGAVFTEASPASLVRHNAWHDRAGILMAHGPDVAAGKDIAGAHLLDIAPTVLQALGRTLSSELDGRPLQSLLAGDAGQTREPGSLGWAHEPYEGVMSPRATSAEAVPSTVLSEGEQEEIRQRLRALGYL